MTKRQLIKWRECPICTRMWPIDIDCPACHDGLPLPGPRDTYQDAQIKEMAKKIK